MPTPMIGDIEIYYQKSQPARAPDATAATSDAPRMLFIGGSGGDLRQTPSVFDGPLAEEFELLAYDQRGLGRSSKPDRDYTMAEYADDAAGLLDHVGWKSCRVMGVSFGGMVAQELAIRHPHCVERLVLACTSSGGAGQPSYPLHALADLSPRERAMRYVEIVDQRNDADWRKANPEAFERMVEFAMKRAAGEHGGDERAGNGARRQLEARRHHDTFDRLTQISAATYLCGGRYDGIAPPDNLQALHARIPDSQLEFFEGGHLFLMQDRAAFPRIIEFLGRP